MLELVSIQLSVWLHGMRRCAGQHRRGIDQWPAETSQSGVRKEREHGAGFYKSSPKSTVLPAASSLS